MFLKIQKYFSIIFVLLSLFSANYLYAGQVSIEKTVFRSTGNSWSINVTLKHKDTGWKHYADAWRVVDANGTEIAKRTLYHPHVNEQPFTRSLSRVKIPDATTVVFIEAHDTVHQWSPTKLKVDLINNKDSNVKILH